MLETYKLSQPILVIWTLDEGGVLGAILTRRKERGRSTIILSL